MTYRVYKVTDMNNGSALVPKRFSAYTKYTMDAFVEPPFGLILAFSSEQDAGLFASSYSPDMRVWEAVTSQPTVSVSFVARVQFGEFQRWWLEGFWREPRRELIDYLQAPKGTVGCRDLKLLTWR